MSEEENVRILKTIKAIKILAIISIITCLICVIGIFLYVQTINTRIDEKNKRLEEILFNANDEFRENMVDKVSELLNSYMIFLPSLEIDLTSEGWQDLGHGLIVSDIVVDEHLTGVKVKGKVINCLSVTQSRISLFIVIGESSKEFEIIEDIEPSYSADFEVYVPDVPIENTNKAKLVFQNSYRRWY